MTIIKQHVEVSIFNIYDSLNYMTQLVKGQNTPEKKQSHPKYKEGTSTVKLLMSTNNDLNYYKDLWNLFVILEASGNHIKSIDLISSFCLFIFF